MRSLIFAVLCFIALSGYASQNYAGNLAVLFAFNCTSLMLTAAGFIGRFSYSYFFLSLFLFLGFWLKFTVHGFVDYPFVEPVGDFDFSPEAWDRVLLAAITIFWGLIVVRLLAVAGEFEKRRSAWMLLVVPEWFSKYRQSVWAVYWLVALALYGANFFHAYFKIGIHPLVSLPPFARVVIPFAVFIGLALVLAALLRLELSVRLRISTWVAIAVVAEGAVASVSMASRAGLIMHVLPFFVAVAVYERRWRAVVLEQKARIAFLTILTLIAVLVVVSLVRIYSYPNPTGLLSVQLRVMALQTALLFSDRWVGLEGLMAATSYSGTGMELLVRAVIEDPKMGVNSLYQYIANASYPESDEFTFLTLPGFGAVLFYGGSFVLAFSVSVLVMLMLLVFEWSIRAATHNQFIVSLACAALANALCQMNFPYLFGTFIVMLLASCGVFAMLRERSIVITDRVILRSK